MINSFLTSAVVSTVVIGFTFYNPGTGYATSSYTNFGEERDVEGEVGRGVPSIDILIFRGVDKAADYHFYINDNADRGIFSIKVPAECGLIFYLLWDNADDSSVLVQFCGIHVGALLQVGGGIGCFAANLVDTSSLWRKFRKHRHDHTGS
ncbi:hypothetical protein AYI70_g5236 [Smittium culicis]|uniref:Uncharacterized protein n=1 Tax=Smittium culicis TaxID=133412 RepID=A0A1R1XVJ2_9FUNG|nr:hypothetical protein AYI70_g5236 [Smittium culicis]